MIYLLGGSGHVGHATPALFQRRGIAVRDVRRPDPNAAGVRSAEPEFPAGTAGGTGNPGARLRQLRPGQ